MKSPIKYFGGKGGMYNDIFPYFPDPDTYNTYIEPFGGSFAMGFQTPEDRIAPIEMYNDLDNNVYALFSVLSDEEKFNEFKKLCDLSYYDEYLRNEYKAQLRNNKEMTDVERAFKFFYVNRSSHNGIGGFSFQRIVRRNMSKNVSDYLSTVDRLSEIHQRLSKVTVMHRDGISILEDFSSPNVFMYCDPPYVQHTRGNTRYDVDMDDDNQLRFIAACIRCKAKLLISGYENELYEKLTDNGFTMHQFEVNTTTGTHKPKTKVETLWKNY